MDRFQIRRITEVVKAFLLSKRSREVFVFLIFVIISAGFWLMQTLNETYDLELRFPLRLINVNRDAVITTELPEDIHVTVRDKGTVLMGYYFRRRRPEVTVDFAPHDNGGTFGHVIVPHTEVQKMLQPLIESTSRIISIRPDTLEYFYNRGSKKRVPVTFRGNLQVVPPNYLAELRCSPDSVTVWGSKDFLDSLTSVPTVVTNISGLDETTSRKVALATIRGAKVEPNEITMVAEVDVYTTKRLEVPIIGTNFPAGLRLRTFPPTVNITFRVGTRDFKHYDKTNFVLTATYEELLSQPDSLLHLKLRSVPEGVSQVRIQPEAVQYLIEQTEEE